MILAVGNTKGGGGKTTIAVNLAILRTAAGQDVLLVDGDEQGSASLFSQLRTDLAALIDAGRGDVPLVRLPLRCGACGATGHRIVVSGRSYGAGEGPEG